MRQNGLKPHTLPLLQQSIDYQPFMSVSATKWADLYFQISQWRKTSNTNLMWSKTTPESSLWHVRAWQGVIMTDWWAGSASANLLHLVTETLIRLCSSARISGCFGQCQHWENEKFALLLNLPWETSSPIMSRGRSEKSSNCMWFVLKYLTA